MIPRKHPLFHTGNCPRKRASRDWMYATYRSLTGQHSVDGQFWTLAGLIVNPTNPTAVQPYSEPAQAIAAGFIRAEQYYGVDHSRSTHAANIQQTEIPNLNLAYGRIEDVMLSCALQGRLDPGAINLDTAHEPRAAVNLMARVGLVLARLPTRPTLIYLNMTLENLYRSKDESDFLNAIETSPEVSRMLSSDWKLLNYSYEYPGSTSASRTHMKLFCFFRGYRSPETRVIG